MLGLDCGASLRIRLRDCRADDRLALGSKAQRVGCRLCEALVQYRMFWQSSFGCSESYVPHWLKRRMMTLSVSARELRSRLLAHLLACTRPPSGGTS